MFLDSQSLTTPTETHDYPEWHKGRKHYALWYIEIHHPELLAYLSDLTEKFSNYLLHPNTRQFHITLYICGFLTEDKKQFDDDFIQSKFQQQLKILSQNQLNSFKLTTGKINSFSSALFIEIQDHENSLSNIRQLLSYPSQEIAALEYCPHITLGLYSAEFKAQQIFKAIEKIDQKSFEISIEQLNFGIYQAQVLQGPLTALHQLILNPKKTDGSWESNLCCN